MRRAINIIFTVIITFLFAALAYFVFSNSYVRLVYAGKDLGLSVGFYFAELFNLDHGIIPSVNNMDGISMPSLSLPSTSEGFVSSAGQYFLLLFSGDNFLRWTRHIAGAINDIFYIFMFVFPAIVAFLLVIRLLYRHSNNKYGRDALPLRIFKRISKLIYQPIKSFVRGYAAFIAQNRWIIAFWAVIWALNFNLLTIVLEAFAYYFYFAVTYDFSSLYTQFVKLASDLATPFKYFHWWL